MAKFYIIDEPNTDNIWLVDLQNKTVESLDRDLIECSGIAGNDFIQSINARSGNIIITEAYRNGPSERLSSASPGQ
ncbi:hypothetical protein [Phyllobacterium myrsinacearum]|uniref:Uncharacterized protein n=1 Tax=Phyllobacterium myrsinacearum TaxID=28101 RepID=A0A839EFP9_9HYPH|nr:hypothetical protein [Phyllobacterium myrsinacearum]MBA8878983.1 hypothetical protein [Phyllobacterium myrsinacearum]